MTDRREQALARVFTICSGISGIVRVTRNEPAVGENSSDRPVIQLYDGDESTSGDLLVALRRAAQPRIVHLVPLIYIMDSGLPEAIGSTMNAHRVNLLKVILSDTTLAGILENEGGINYTGCSATYTRGRMMEGEMRIMITFTYYLKPFEL